MADILFTCQFIASKVGLNGIAVTVNVERVTRSDGTRLALVTGGAINVVYGRNGLYGYRLTGADLTLYDYIATFITADATVDQQEIAAMWTLWSISWHDILTTALTAVGSIGALFISTLDAAISSRGTADAGDAMTLEAAERTTLAGLVDTELSGVHGAGSWESAGGGDYTEVLADIKAKTDRIGTGTATLVAPVTRSGQVRIIQGDAYYNTDSGRALDWSDDTWNVAETSTVVVVLHGVITFVAERLSATQIRLELSSEQTLALPVGNAVFSVQEITAGGNTLSRVPYGAWNTAAQPIPVYEA